jgi:hypothetical protein
MEEPTTQPQPFYHRLAVKIAGAIVLLVPVAYFAGRAAATAHLASTGQVFATGASAIAFGALLGIPLGLFFGSVKSQAPGPVIQHFHPSFVKQQDKILEELKSELSRDKSLLQTRLGDSSSTTGVRYDTAFWRAVQSSGQLFVMQEPKLLATLARTYYWLEEANRIEGFAFEAHFNGAAIDHQSAVAHLLEQARLLDGVIGTSLDAAIISINAQLQYDQVAPDELTPEPVIAHREVVEAK